MDQQQQQQQAKVERFLKLGYTHGDIVRVLESLHHDAQTNDILEELIKTCHIRSNKSLPGSPKLVSRGCSPAPAQPRPGSGLGQGPEREWEREPPTNFRPVVIDGSNVAMSHGDKKVFSCQGIQLAVNWFWDKGLRDITVFIPLWRKEQPRPETPITDQHLLHELESRKILVYTPSRCVNGKRVVCYDDRYIVKLAFDSDGVIVSNDNYRDLQTENPQWKKFIEERLLMYTFANDKFMPPDDPLGRNGPNIDDFLRKKPRCVDSKPQHCPYGKKCTYGVKCKFYHPERANQSQLSVADELRALRDKAKTFSSLQDAHCYAPPQPPQLEQRHAPATPPPPVPPLSTDEHYIYQRDSSSPRLQPCAGLLRCPSADTDEAFGSLDSCVSRLYIQDPGCSVEPPLHSRSSGLASCSLGPDDYSLCGSYGGKQQRSSSGRVYFLPPSGEHCLHCRCGHHQSRSSPQQLGWGSCPLLHNREQPSHFSDIHNFTQPVLKQSLSQSSPSEPWAALRRQRRAGSPGGEQRSSLRSQLSTLFPQSAVEQVLNDYPHVSDLSQLIPLIHSYRSSHMAL